MPGGTILGWDSLSVSPVPVPALGLCNSGELATHLLSLPARHQLIGNILQQASQSPTLQSLSQGAVERQLREVLIAFTSAK